MIKETSTPKDPAQELYKKRNIKEDLYREVEPFSMWSFFLSIAPFVLFPILSILVGPIIPIFSIAGIILGFIGLHRISKNQKKFKGKGFAIAGISISAILLLLVIIGLIIFIFFMSNII